MSSRSEVLVVTNRDDELCVMSHDLSYDKINEFRRKALAGGGRVLLYPHSLLPWSSLNAERLSRIDIRNGVDITFERPTRMVAVAYDNIDEDNHTVNWVIIAYVDRPGDLERFRSHSEGYKLGWYPQEALKYHDLDGRLLEYVYDEDFFFRTRDQWDNILNYHPANAEFPYPHVYQD